MYRLLLLVALAAALVPATATASASAATKWLCRPGQAHNPCAVGYGTTSFTPRSERIGVQHPKARRPIDCFYVYPTVSDEPGPQASLAVRPELRSIARYQAARFGQLCRVYAPVYRQLTLAGINGTSGGSDALAYGDVRAAFREYLRRFNHGRGFVLIGHSQGSFHLERLLSRVIDPSPALRRKMVSAILLGGNVQRKDYKHVRPCARPGQLHCIVAWSTFDERPPASAIFGRGSVCTDPVKLRGGRSTRLHPIFPNVPFAPGTLIAAGIAVLGFTPPAAPTPWVAIPGAFSGHCVTQNGATVLRVLARGGAPTLNPSPTASWGLHLVDVNIALGDELEIVARQTRAYLRGA